MKKHQRALILKILPVILLSTAIGISLFYGEYILSIFLALAVYYAVYNLIRFHNQTIMDSKRLIDAIRFSEFNISFNNIITKGLYADLGIEMENSIGLFNEKMQEKESELSFYDILLNRIDFAIIVLNQSKKIKWINKAALELFGKPRPKQLSDLKSVSAELPKILEKLTPKEMKILKLQKEHDELNLAVTMVSASIRGEELKIFNLKNIQPVLDESESEAWKKLIRILTHEIMNSITPIISLAETFSEQEDSNYDPEMMNRAMQTIHRRSKGLVQFVNNYQRLARIPAPDFTTFGLHQIMEDITNLLRAHQIVFLYSINPGDISIRADRGQIEQVLINLIKNAWEACSQNEVPIINVKIEKDIYQRPLILISDNGTGILPDVLDKIFIPFFTTKKEGSGIGLSICRQIISTHGGTITVSSNLDGGTCFTISL